LVHWKKEWLLGATDGPSMPLRSKWPSSRGERAGRTKRDIESAEYAQKRVVLFRKRMFGDHLAMQVAIGFDPQRVPAIV